MGEVFGFRDVIALLNRPSTEYSGGSLGRADLPWGVGPEKYLQFAQTDSKRPSIRGRVNSLSNAKRALHCQVDSILFCLGYWPYVVKHRWSFPSKLELLHEMDVVAPAIVSRVNRHRNEIEHEYVAPPGKDELTDLLEVVELFLAATSRLAAVKYDSFSFDAIFRRKRGEFTVSLVGDLELEVWAPAFGARDPLTVDTYRQFRQLQTAVFQALHRGSALTSY